MKISKKDLRKCLFAVYRENRIDDEFEDDCFLHIVRSGVRFAFYNGQGTGDKDFEDLPVLDCSHLHIAVKVVEELFTDQTDKESQAEV